MSISRKYQNKYQRNMKEMPRKYQRKDWPTVDSTWMLPMKWTYMLVNTWVEISLNKYLKNSLKNTLLSPWPVPPAVPWGHSPSHWMWDGQTAHPPHPYQRPPVQNIKQISKKCHRNINKILSSSSIGYTGQFWVYTFGTQYNTTPLINVSYPLTFKTFN